MTIASDWVVEQPDSETLTLEQLSVDEFGVSISVVSTIVSPGDVSEFTVENGATGIPGTYLAVVGEIPVGLVNGSNATFTSQLAFIPLSVEVLINGISQTYGIDFTTTGFYTINMSDSPSIGDSIRINYLRSS